MQQRKKIGPGIVAIEYGKGKRSKEGRREVIFIHLICQGGVKSKKYPNFIGTAKKAYPIGSSSISNTLQPDLPLPEFFS
ncbi:hypothetical protein CEXT_723151 [Caerostris extrusa]|uniref:Uncharacterized protein n=1 Tax=Caerostris extrusa TaxID=172846 RepID=A0AAV4XAE0_CAEEX|nr:hypothetical protein CEXT_723151 [Caerostris extrusa]